MADTLRDCAKITFDFLTPPSAMEMEIEVAVGISTVVEASTLLSGELGL